ncbi:MAG: hypothetical protein U9R51_02555, partial [Actinomycetota bacterium]|nr:hypothetical protein [Actinomycetota bacterium]
PGQVTGVGSGWDGDGLSPLPSIHRRRGPLGFPGTVSVHDGMLAHENQAVPRALFFAVGSGS